MAHKNRSIFFSGVLLAGIAVSVLIPSCVDERYDLKNGLSTVMSLGGDSLTIPLGSTDSIKLSDFLDPEDIEMLKVMENGGYGLTMKDSIEETLNDLLPQDLKIQDQIFSENQTISFGDISLEDFSIPAISRDTTISLVASSVSMGNFNVPTVSKEESFSAGMSAYVFNKPTLKDTTVNGGKIDILGELILPENPGVSGIELPIKDTLLPSFSSNNNINYKVSVPEGVTGINRIELSDNDPHPVLEISIEFPGATNVLNKGVITPDITIDPSDMFIFNTPLEGGIIKFDSNTPLNKVNSYKQVKTFNIDALNITGEPSGGNLNILDNIIASGTLNVTGVTVMSEDLSLVGDIDILIKVSVKNMKISSMDFNIPSISSTISGSVPITVNSTLPTEIKSVDKVYFNNPPTISFDLKALSLPIMISKTVKIEELSIHFPNEFVFYPALPGNTYTLTDEVLANPTTGKQVTLTLKEMNFSNVNLDSQNKLIWNDAVSYSGSVSFNGRINSENIPSSETEDPRISINVSSALAFKSADVTTNIIEKPFSPFNVNFNIDIDISDQVKSLGVINLDPGKKLRIDLTKPILPLNLAANNIVIHFPPLFQFKQTLPGNNYVIDGNFPDFIELELASLNINKTLANGKLNLSETVNISGGALLESGSVNSSEFADFDGKMLGVRTSIPALTMASTSIQLNTLEATYKDTTKLNFVFDDFPDEIASIDSIILGNNAILEISIDLTDVPALNKSLIGNMVIDFPDLIMFKPGEVDANNRMVVNKTFSNNKMTITAGIKGFRFNGNPISGQFTLNEDLGFNIGITVDEPSINSEEITDNPIGVAVNVKLTDMTFKKFYGIVNPAVEPIIENVDISDLPDFLKEDDVVLDITKPIIILEGISNLGIPLIANLEFKPIKNGAVITEGKQTVTLNLPRTQSSSVLQKTTFWLSPDNAGMPEGYTFVEADVQKLFRTIPDKIELTVNAHSDISVKHEVDVDAEYAIKLKYDVSLPMAFGNELNIVMRDTIKDIDKSIGKIVTGNKLELIGSFYNSIPLELNVELTPLDKDFQKINVIPATQVINAGAVDGSAVKTDLSVVINDPQSLLKGLKAFELKFTANSNETVAGTPIKPSNFVKADLKVRLKGGISIGDE